MSKADVLTIDDIKRVKRHLDNVSVKVWDLGGDEYYLYIYNLAKRRYEAVSELPYMWGKEARDLWVEEVFPSAQEQSQ